MDDHDDQSETEGERVLEVRHANLGEAQRREPFAPLTAEAPLTPQELRARQQAIDDHRRYVGPLFENEPLTAAMDPSAAEEDVEPTEVAPAPEPAESES